MLNKLIVDEIFYSLQGEGGYCGDPAIFIRLSPCNLKCVWCDTDADPKADQYVPTNSIEMTIDEILQSIKDIQSKCNFQMRHYVVTGGEPMVQQKMITKLFQKLRDKSNLGRGYDSGDMIVEVETNGTIMPDNELVNVVDIFNVSLKLSSSRNKTSRAEKPEVIKWFAEHQDMSPFAAFKFVIDDNIDFAEMERIVKAYELEPGLMFLMPCGTTAEELSEKMKWLAPLCMKHGYLLSPRLQVHIWGNQRGT